MYLGSQALEQSTDTLIPNQIADDNDTRHLLLEVCVLYAGLDDVERRSDCDRRDGACDGGNEVLSPCGLGVVGDSEDHVLC